MKYLFILLILLPFAGFAQTPVPYGFEGYRTYNCINFVIEQFAKKNDSLTCHLDSIIKPQTRTIYIMKTAYMEQLPDSVNGYKIKLVDVEGNTAFLYKEQKENCAVILYLSDGQPKNSSWTIWVMPMVAIKKGMKKPVVEYDNSQGFKAVFFYNDATAKFTYDKTECYSAGH
jgi:hypothetical protein